jgi:formylglycine-generating enzyme required for sulfatase activity
MDMAGNVKDWCLNVYADPEKPESVCVNDSDSRRVVRGGSWTTYRENLRTSFRARHNAGLQDYLIGFRLAQDIR